MKRKLKFRVAIPAFALLVVLMFPFSYIHELGHASVCASEGNTFDITIDLNGGHIVCHDTVNNHTLYTMMGGLLAMSIAALPFIFYNKIKKYSFVVIAFAVLAIGHGINAGIETIFYETYMQDAVLWGMIMGLFAFLMFIGLATRYAKKEVSAC